jgi:hypothetical protein
MLDFNQTPNYLGPTTTTNSERGGRLKVDVGGQKRKKLLKKILNKNHGSKK